MLCVHLLPGFSTELDQIAHVQSIGTRRCNCENGIWKFQSVAMEMRKFSHRAAIGLMVLNFCMEGLCGHNNLYAKNRQNLPHGCGDSAHSNGLATRVRQRLWSFMMSMVTSSVASFGMTSCATSFWRSFLWSHICDSCPTQLTRAPREGQGPSTSIFSSFTAGWQT